MPGGRFEYTVQFPEDKETWRGLGRDGKSSSVPYLGTGNITPKPCEEDEITSRSCG